MRNQRSHVLVVLTILLALVLSAVWPVVAQEPEPLRRAPAEGPLDQMPLATFSPDRTASASFVPGEVLVKPKAGIPERATTEIMADYGATRAGVLYGNDVELWQVPEGEELDIVAGLNADPGVAYAQPNFLYWAFDTTPNDPYLGRQWAHNVVGSPAAWDVSTGSTSVVIAILDTGVDMGHPDLAGKLVSGYDFVDGDSSPADLNGHGTHVAGIAGALTNNATGVAGMDWQARIMPVRVLNEGGGGSSTHIANGIWWAADHGAKVINLSLGGPTLDPAMQDAVNHAYSAGSLVVAAMGNENNDTPMYPAALNYVMAVSATGPTDDKASYSNWGNHCDISAPGGDMDYYYDPDGIYSTMPTYPVYMTTVEYFRQNYDYAHGTSQAAPYVSGLAALIWSLNSALTPAQVQDQIEDTATDLGVSGWDPIYGYGRINAFAALSDSAEPSTPTLAPISNPDGDGTYLVDWTTVATASSYTLQEDDNPGFGSPAIRYSGGNSQYQVTGQGGGIWYYRVRASNVNGDSSWSAVQSVTVKPAAPSLDPIVNIGDQDTYTVTWSASTGASGYTLQEDDNPAFSSPRTRYEGTTLEYHVTGQAGGNWYYRSRAFNSAGGSPWSSVMSTSVDPPALDAPVLSPIDNVDGDGDFVVDWTEVVSATTYLLEEAGDPYFVSAQQVYSGTITQVTMTDQAGGHLYYRVRAYSPTGRGPWSNEESVIVLSHIFLPNVMNNHVVSFVDENFEGGVVPPSGWSRLVSNTSHVTTTWSAANINSFSGSHHASVHWDPALEPQNEVLLSPQFQTTSAQLGFYSRSSLYWCRDTYDNCDLDVWLVVGDWGGGDDVKVHKADGDWVTSWQWAPSTVSLTPYLPPDKPVRVGFQYIGHDGAEISLDSISIVQ